MDFERLGAFYLGKQYDVEAHQLLDQLLMYDARDLTTHAVCVGMTGSGKTGLCIDLLEEAALDQVPAIILDPKGDITNLLLQFPELRPEDFRPWINSDDARRKGLNLDEYAAKQADTWRDGLARWGQSGERIRKLQDSAEFAIYTPGSDAGLPVSILRAFSPPDGAEWGESAETLRERIEGTVGALLSLIGADTDPVQSREHVLLANIFEHYWRRGEPLDLTRLILAVQNPPMRQLGVFDLDTFFPEKERIGLAMSMNNLLASPSFQSWLQGQALDIGEFLASERGKPRHSIFYLAHLNEAERVFFVAMLLNEVVSWMRTQAGTTSLRALVYMDEIFGFFPPVANPPSKKPMLTLLKQARAYGVGLVLATQNPVDLDYKGLTNAGTWFIGRLQTERDKKRILDGLEGVSSSAGKTLSRAALSKLISDLDKRVFLLHNVHEEAPVAFNTRWAMSYLRGPMTRTQISDLMAPRASAVSPRERRPEDVRPGSDTAPATAGYLSTPPSLSASIEQIYLRTVRDHTSAFLDIETRENTPVQRLDHRLLFKPVLFASGRVHFVDKRRKVEGHEEFALLSPGDARVSSAVWEEAAQLQVSDASRLYSTKAPDDALYEPVPETMNEVRELGSLKKELSDHLYRTRSLDLLFSPSLKEYSNQGESEREFQMRIRQLAREARDEEVEKLNRRFDSRLRKLEDRIERAQLALDKKEAASQARSREFFVSVGESLVGMFLGRRSLRSASSSLSKYRMKSSAKMAIEEAEERVESLEEEAAALEEELKDQIGTITEKWDEIAEELETVPITPRRSDVKVDLIAVAWEPHWLVSYKDRNGAKRTESSPAYQR